MQHHDLLARVVEQLPVGVFAFSADGAVLLWNSRAERLTGWERDRVLRDGLAGLPLDAPTARRIRDELLAGRPFRGRIPADVQSGATLYFRAEPVPGPTEQILVGVLQEVDDTRAGDEAFALLDALWETAPVGLVFFDRELRYRRVNGAVLDIDGGYGRRAAGPHARVGARRGRAPLIAEGLREVLADGRARFDVPVRGRLWHGRGPMQEWRIYSYPVRSPDGEIVGVGMVVVDVTAAARTRREVDALAAERERALTRYQSLVEATSAAVWIREPDGSAEHDAPALRAITGQSAAAYRGWGFLDAVDPAHRDAVRAAWRTAIAEAAEVVTCTYRLCTDRGFRWFHSRAVPVRVAGRRRRVGRHRDRRGRRDPRPPAPGRPRQGDPGRQRGARPRGGADGAGRVGRAGVRRRLPRLPGRPAPRRGGFGHRAPVGDPALRRDPAVPVERRAVLLRGDPPRRPLRPPGHLGAGAAHAGRRAGLVQHARAAPLDRRRSASRRCWWRRSSRAAS